MATTTTTPTRPVEITDPTLLNVHTQRETAYAATQLQINDTLPSLKEASRKLPGFYGEVRARGSALQAGTVEIPTKEKLEEEKTGYLQRYQAFKTAHDATALLSENILGTITFLTPVQRSWTLEESLKTGSPGLYAQMKRSEEICLGFIGKLTEAHVKVEALKTDLFTQINGKDLTWSLQRFCQIVENDGKPLGFVQRSTNYVSASIFAPEIPKPNVPITSSNGESLQMHDLTQLTESMRMSFATQSTVIIGGNPTGGVSTEPQAAVVPNEPEKKETAGGEPESVSVSKEPAKQESDTTTEPESNELSAQQSVNDVAPPIENAATDTVNIVSSEPQPVPTSQDAVVHENPFAADADPSSPTVFTLPLEPAVENTGS